MEDKVQGTVCQVQVAEDKEQDLQHKDQAVEVRAQVLEFPVKAAEGRELELEVKEPAATGLEPACRGWNLPAGAPMNDGTVNGPALSAGGGNPSGPSSYRGRNWRRGYSREWYSGESLSDIRRISGNRHCRRLRE